MATDLETRPQRCHQRICHEDATNYAAFFKKLPKTLDEVVNTQKDLCVLVKKHITSDLHGLGKSERQWAVAHSVKLSHKKLRDLSKALYEEVHGTALLPHAAAAALLAGSGRRQGYLGGL